MISICLFVPQQTAHICFPRAGQERRAFLFLQSGQVDFDISKLGHEQGKASDHANTALEVLIMTGWLSNSRAILSLLAVDPLPNNEKRFTQL